MILLEPSTLEPLVMIQFNSYFESSILIYHLILLLDSTIEFLSHLILSHLILSHLILSHLIPASAQTLAISTRFLLNSFYVPICPAHSASNNSPSISQREEEM